MAEQTELKPDGFFVMVTIGDKAYPVKLTESQSMAIQTALAVLSENEPLKVVKKKEFILVDTNQ